MADKHRAGSRKAKVHEHFNLHGANDAMNLGMSLGLAVGTLRSWVRGWEKSGTTPTTKQKAAVIANSKRIRDVANPRMTGTLLDQGPEVSEVRWDNGRKQYVPNGHIVELKGGRANAS